MYCRKVGIWNIDLEYEFDISCMDDLEYDVEISSILEYYHIRYMVINIGPYLWPTRNVLGLHAPYSNRRKERKKMISYFVHGVRH